MIGRPWLAMAVPALLALAGFAPVGKAQTESSGQYLLITVAHDAARDAATHDGIAPSGWGDVYRDDRRGRLVAQAIARRFSLDFEQGWQIAALNVYCAMLRAPSDADVTHLARRLANESRIDSVQPVVDYEAQAANGRNYRDLQRIEHLTEPLVEADGGQGITLGIIDTAVDLDHPDLSGQVGRLIELTGSRPPALRHGTAVAGVIAAAGEGNQGIVGIAPRAEVIVLAACWQATGTQEAARCNSFTIASALSRAIDERVDVLNMSLAGPFDPLVARLVDAAHAQGMVIVAADPQRAGFGYPAGLPGVLAVREGIAADPAEPNTVYRMPSDVISTAPQGAYDFFGGVSMSTAVVSGTVALLRKLDRAHETKELADAFRRLDRSPGTMACMHDAGAGC